jgi:hypothetical protein
MQEEEEDDDEEEEEAAAQEGRGHTGVHVRADGKSLCFVCVY